MINKFFIVVITLLMAYIFVFNPFISEVFLPKIVRSIIPLCFYICCFVLLYKRKKDYLKLTILIVCILALFACYWLLQDTLIISNAILVLSSIILVLFAYPILSYDKAKFNYVSKIWNILVWVSVIMTILSFIVFNYVGKTTFVNKSIGPYSTFGFYFSPIFGIISERTFLIFKLGRPAWLLAEPSYLGFFHGLNFFWFYYQNKLNKSTANSLGKASSILALLFTLSLGSWVALLVAFIVSSFKDISIRLLNYNRNINLKKLRFQMVVFSIIALLIILNINRISSAYNFAVDYAENINKYSSLQDRTNRIEISKKLIDDSNIAQILFGRGPGTIEHMFEQGESNGWIKSFIEGGASFLLAYVLLLLSFILVSHKNIFLVVFVLISFNSIIILFSPFVTFYLSILFFLSKKTFIKNNILKGEEFNA